MYGGNTEEDELFMNGNSQAVRIPGEFQLYGDEVEIQHRGNTLLIRSKKQTWRSLTDSLAMFTDDFMEEGRQQPERLDARLRAAGVDAGAGMTPLP